MKRRRLPPLNPLKNFEAAARLASFTRAAEELSVTPVAVSRQINVLEGYFGRPLFHRQANTVKLTEIGRELLPAVTTALDLLDDSARRLRSAPSDVLVVCTYQPLAMRWLIPRLPRFCSEHRDININLTTAIRPHEFDYDRIDVGIQHGLPLQRDTVAEAILPDVVVPVCSPELAGGSHPLPPVENLARHTFLQSRFRRLDWQDWLQTARLESIQPQQELTFNSSALAVQAAVEGLGVAVAQRLLVDDELDSGRLIMPFREVMQRPAGFSIAVRQDRLQDSRIKAFWDWIREEAGETSRGLGVTVSRLDSELPQLCVLAEDQ